MYIFIRDLLYFISSNTFLFLEMANIKLNSSSRLFSDVFYLRTSQYCNKKVRLPELFICFFLSKKTPFNINVSSKQKRFLRAHGAPAYVLSRRVARLLTHQLACTPIPSSLLLFLPKTSLLRCWVSGLLQIAPVYPSCPSTRGSPSHLRNLSR